MSHTPGPWVLGEDDTIVCAGDGRAAERAVALRHDECGIVWANPADAALACAAPALLAACEAALLEMGPYDHFPPSVAVREELRAAIRLAKGST